MDKTIIFNEQEWVLNPEKYPMVKNWTLSPLIPYCPRTSVLGAQIEDGAILMQRESGHWFAIPSDIFDKIREVI